MDTDLLIGLRNAILFSMIISAGALFPENRMNVPASLLRMWKLSRDRRCLRKSMKSDSSRAKFWEIDMTKFEP